MTTVEEHTERVKRHLRPFPDNWVPARAGIDHDVLIVGGAQSGAMFQFALRQVGIANVSVIDAAPDLAAAGIWRNTARMPKLRTQKRLQGPELGNAELAFQAWYEAGHGAAAYEALTTIPRLDWIDYLDWYRRVTGTEVRFGTHLDRIEPVAEGLRLHLTVQGRPQVETARKVILANGLLGGGGPNIPAIVQRALPKSLYAHTSEKIDFAALSGKTVGVLGAAASAFDAAAAALEAGAAAVHLFVKRPHVAIGSAAGKANHPGAIYSYDLLSDADRWSLALRKKIAGGDPPPDAVKRAVAFPNFHLHLSSPLTDVGPVGDGVAVTTPQGRFVLDHLVLGTGFAGDPALRTELADLKDHILRWRDRDVPLSTPESAALGSQPYLGSGYQYLPRTPDAPPTLSDIHVFNASAHVSFGAPVGDVPSIRRGVPAIVQQILRDLFRADQSDHLDRARQGGGRSDGSDLYRTAVWQAPSGPEAALSHAREK